MNKLTIKYEIRTFFGLSQLITDSKDNATIEDVRKVFNFLKKNQDAAMDFDKFTLIWESPRDFNNGIINVITHLNAFSDTSELMSFTNAKKLITTLFKEAQ